MGLPWMAQGSEVFARFVAGRRLHFFWMMFSAGVCADLARRTLDDLESHCPAKFQQNTSGYSWIARNEFDHAQFLIRGIIGRLAMLVGPGPELDAAKEALAKLSDGSCTPQQAIAMAEEVNMAVI